MADDLGIAPQVEVQDATHSSGSVSLFHESNPGFFDDILVRGAGDGTSVDAQGKLATYWGSVKNLRR